MGTLISSIIVFLAIVFGLSFLFFKLICVLAQNKSNKLPLILAGVITGLVALFTGWASYKIYKQVFKPIMPIVETAKNYKQPVYGEKIYTDSKYGFSFTQYNGTVFGDWFDFSKMQCLVGIDLNVLLQQRQQEKQTPFTGFVLVRYIQPQPEDASQQMQYILTELQGKSSSNGSVQFTGQPEVVDVGPQATASFITATLYPRQMPEGIPGAL